MKINNYIFILSIAFLAEFLHAFSRSFQSYAILYFVTCIVYFIIGFISQKTPINFIKKYFLLVSFFILDAIQFKIINENRNIYDFMVVVSGLSFCYLGLSFKSEKLYIFSNTLISFFLIAVTFLFIPSYKFKNELVKNDKKLPKTILTDTKGSSINTENLIGKTIVLCMWQTKSAPMHYYNDIENIYQHFKNNSSVNIIGVNTGKDDFGWFLGFETVLREQQMHKIPMLIDEKSVIYKTLNLKAPSQCIIIDKKGLVRQIIPKYTEESRYMYKQRVIDLIENEVNKQ